MAKYIKKEMPDLSGKGKTGAYYRMATFSNIGTKEFMEKCAKHSGISQSAIMGSLSIVSEELARQLADGYSVTIDGLGTFSTKLGVKETKELDNFEKDGKKRNAQSLEVSGIVYRADKKLVRITNQICTLERAGERRLARSKYSPAERLDLAKEFMAQNGFMHVYDYVKLTGLSYTTASLELRNLADDPESGITSRGQKSAKLYLPAQPAQE